MGIIFSVIAIILLFGLTVFVHELGHYLVARWVGMVIDTFSIGFGPAIWKKQIKGVDYRIGCIPFGGYVALPQMEPGGAKDEDGQPRNLPPIAPWKKIPVSLAGAFFNVLLALAIATFVYYAADPEQRESPPSVLGYVDSDSAAAEAGLAPGDKILSVNGVSVRYWNDFLLECAFEEQVEVAIISPAGQTRTINLDTEKNPLGGRWVPGLDGPSRCAVLGIRSGSSAEEAGLQPNDVLISFDNRELYSRAQLIAAVQDARDRPVPVTVQRSDEIIELSVTPRYDEAAGRALIGIEFNLFDTFQSPLVQVRGWAAPVFKILQALGNRESRGEAAASVGGPVMIFIMFWYAVRSSLLLALWFTGMINVNLAIINLLPIPVLDGGHIVFAVIESLVPKALPARIHAWMLRIFAVLLIALFALITLRDINRTVIQRFMGGDEAAEPAEIEESAPATHPED